MRKPIVDGAEVSIDFPDKAYFGTFGRSSGFSIDREDDGIAMKLIRGGEDKRVAAFHLHYYLLADMIAEIARAMKSGGELDDAHREQLLSASEALVAALKPHHKKAGKHKKS